jgi:hypothetical protein
VCVRLTFATIQLVPSSKLLVFAPRPYDSPTNSRLQNGIAAIYAPVSLKANFSLNLPICLLTNAIAVHEVSKCGEASARGSYESTGHSGSTPSILLLSS